MTNVYTCLPHGPWSPERAAGSHGHVAPPGEHPARASPPSLRVAQPPRCKARGHRPHPWKSVQEPSPGLSTAVVRNPGRGGVDTCVRAAVPKRHTGRFNRHLFSGSGRWTSKIKGSTGLVSPAAPPLGLQMATLTWSSPVHVCVLTSSSHGSTVASIGAHPEDLT